MPTRSGFISLQWKEGFRRGDTLGRRCAPRFFYPDPCGGKGNIREQTDCGQHTSQSRVRLPKHRLYFLMNHLNIVVHGKVQGVNFRHYTMEKAFELGVKGFVKNNEDGTVYVEAEGNAEQLQKFIEWCQKGPSRAEVKSVQKSEGALKNYVSFEIRR